jgi:pimeloyl-ACP methyl ester carboxylesterase
VVVEGPGWGGANCAGPRVSRLTGAAGRTGHGLAANAHHKLALSYGFIAGAADAGRFHNNKEDSALAALQLEKSVMKVGGVEFELLEGGAGPALLFLHDAFSLWPEPAFVERLAAKYRVLAPSHPGFGATALPAWLSSVDDFAHLYIELLDKRGIDSLRIVGASLGAWVALELAVKLTRRVTKMALIGPLGLKLGTRDRLDFPDVFATPLEELAKKVFVEGSSAPSFDFKSRTDEELLRLARHRETLALVGWEHYLHNPKLVHRLTAVSAPTLVLRGEHDGIVAPWYAEALVSRLPAARLQTIPASAHLPHLEQQDAVSQVVLDFLE